MVVPGPTIDGRRTTDGRLRSWKRTEGRGEGEGGEVASGSGGSGCGSEEEEGDQLGGGREAGAEVRVRRRGGEVEADARGVASGAEAARRGGGDAEAGRAEAESGDHRLRRLRRHLERGGGPAQ